jgi:hypothetical protein
MTGALNGGGGHGAPKLRLLQGRAALAHYGSALEYSEPRLLKLFFKVDDDDYYITVTLSLFLWC